MSQDRSSFDDLPDDDSPGTGGGRQTRIIATLLSLLLVAGAVVVVVLLAGQRSSVPDEPTTGITTAAPSDEPSDDATGEADLDAALADLDAARSTLTTAITSAEDLLAATEGVVVDETSRDALADALTTARSTLDADVDRTRVGDVQSTTTRTRAATANLQHAAGLVADSHEEWLTQQTPTPDPVDLGVPAPDRPVDPVPVPTDREPLPGPTIAPDRTPRPGPAPIPVPDNQN